MSFGSSGPEEGEIAAEGFANEAFENADAHGVIVYFFKPKASVVVNSFEAGALSMLLKRKAPFKKHWANVVRDWDDTSANGTRGKGMKA
ncbi:hypothetical protein niasHT_010922 [Heterodera trifolii]|uniref:Uncharacterized protein n=1 Tax=Heterodera trifolii TaxID=157864 RepID=A0ABD2LFV5_9BILA